MTLIFFFFFIFQDIWIKNEKNIMNDQSQKQFFVNNFLSSRRKEGGEKKLSRKKKYVKKSVCVKSKSKRLKECKYEWIQHRV